jgi:hypothetical protein
MTPQIVLPVGSPNFPKWRPRMHIYEVVVHLNLLRSHAARSTMRKRQVPTAVRNGQRVCHGRSLEASLTHHSYPSDLISISQTRIAYLLQPVRPWRRACGAAQECAAVLIWLHMSAYTNCQGV